MTELRYEICVLLFIRLPQIIPSFSLKRKLSKWLFITMKNPWFNLLHIYESKSNFNLFVMTWHALWREEIAQLTHSHAVSTGMILDVEKFIHLVESFWTWCKNNRNGHCPCLEMNCNVLETVWIWLWRRVSVSPGLFHRNNE